MGYYLDKDTIKKCLENDIYRSKQIKYLKKMKRDAGVRLAVMLSILASIGLCVFFKLL